MTIEVKTNTQNITISTPNQHTITVSASTQQPITISTSNPQPITISTSKQQSITISSSNTQPNADTVDGFHASSTPTPNTLLPLNANAKISASLIEGTVDSANTANTANTATNSDTVDGFHLNQDVRTTASPTFAGLSVTGNVGIGTTNPNYQLELSTDSAAKPTTNTWTTTSDKRVKTNITPADLERCYEIVKAIPLVHHGWAEGLYSDDVTNDKSQLGWIAQDVEAVFPKAVSTRPIVFYKQIEDGVEEYEEQAYSIENVEVEEKVIEIRNGVPVQVVKKRIEEIKHMLFEDVQVVDENGNVVLDENGNPLTYKMPVMVKKTRPKMKPVQVIEDGKQLNSDQIIKALYGAVQLLIKKVETLETKIV